jgi:hypothetical protein
MPLSCVDFFTLNDLRLCRHVPYLNLLSECAHSPQPASCFTTRGVAVRFYAKYSLPFQVRKKNQSFSFLGARLIVTFFFFGGDSVHQITHRRVSRGAYV